MSVHFTCIILPTLVGVVAASPIARSSAIAAVEKRGVLISAWLAVPPPALSRPRCAACLVGCMGTADDGGEIDLDSATTEAS
ncbi:hypothetical protein PENARI_c007G00553 [Penicillium arizonense]|uniref:Secreted protein n=1 Tax=Penicillium arizonense TaxID=1835702 RepID=A0A1F5LL56_PENAI|nr:hypothetical protein PENARI_c007G00553 [Penicillium arizonense]OGE53661.1 hypothetical protein PENARI_c007G00553 [Penicillium arizonense]